MIPIGEILGQKQFAKSDNISRLEEYIFKEYGYRPRLAVKTGTIVIHMKSAAEANSLRMRYRQLLELCDSKTRKLYIHTYI